MLAGKHFGRALNLLVHGEHLLAVLLNLTSTWGYTVWIDSCGLFDVAPRRAAGSKCKLTCAHCHVAYGAYGMVQRVAG